MFQTSALGPHDVEQAHGLRQHDHADDRKPHRDLVADHLRAGPEAAEDGVFAVGGPATEDHAVDLDPDHRKDEEERHIHVGDVERISAPRTETLSPKGIATNTTKGGRAPGLAPA